MPIVNTNFIAGRMNKSVDERLVPPGEYINAINVRLGSTETTEIGAVENSKGNSQLTILTYGGQALSEQAKCLGAYEDGSKETLYWFIHDSNNPVATDGIVDMVVSFNTNTQVIAYHIITLNLLNFNVDYLITGVNKIEDLLFWTDNFNPPRKINVTSNYNDPVGDVDGIIEDDISVILKPPGYTNLDNLTAPAVNLISAPGDENYLDERFITFAYRYRYVDQEYSATSLFTKPAFAPGPFRFDTNNYNNAGMVNQYNTAEVTFNTGGKNVIQVDLLFKPTDSNVIFVIERFNKSDYGWANNTNQTYTFTNSKIYTSLGSDELLRLYDNVPKTAKAQTIMGNRLMYANYTDGYNITNSNDISIPINYTTSHLVNDILFEDLSDGVLSQGINYTINATIAPTSVPNSKITFDLSNQVLLLKQGSSFNFTLDIEHADLNGTTADACYDASFENPNFSLDFSFLLDQDYLSVSDMVNSEAFANRIGTIEGTNFEPIADSSLGSSLTDFFNSEIIAPTNCAFVKSNSSITQPLTQEGFKLTNSGNTFSLQLLAMKFLSGTTEMYEYFRITQGTGSFTSQKDTSSLHSNRDYDTGIVYMDSNGRASTVLVSENNTIFVPTLNSVNQNKIKVNIENLPPSWATKYKFVSKSSGGNYETLYSNFYYQATANRVVYFKLEGQNQNIPKAGDVLIVKRDASGPLERLVKSEVLAVEAEAVDFLATAAGLGEDSNQLAGLYMQMKPSNFSIAIDDNAVIDLGDFNYRDNSGSRCKAKVSYPCFYTNDDATTNNYTIPAGSQIYMRWFIRRVDRNNCSGVEWLWERTYVSTADYTDMYQWFKGDDIDPGVGEMIENVDDKMNQAYFTSTLSADENSIICTPFEPNFQFWQATPGDAASPLYLTCRSGLRGCGAFGSTSNINAEIVVTRANNLIVWETEPLDASSDLYYDASESYNITNGFHMGGKGDGDQSQTANRDAIVTLPFANCYTFGNGVESYKINDSLVGKSFNLGERTLAVSTQDFKSANRFAGMTYSGVYTSSSNVNNLNEFNLGLVNFKDLETSFGPVMILHARETDILVLQEDKISYVLASKNLISDSTGGGAIASVPEILGTQIARIEEFGISFNPESFTSWGFDMYFTDTKRASVIKLSGSSRKNDELEVISDTGMRSWFRDQFNVQLNTQKLGGYDPYMDEYVLGTNGTSVPLAPIVIPCGTTQAINDTSTVRVYTVELGEVIGNVIIDYTIGAGTLSVVVEWDGSIVASIYNTTTSGSINFDKTKRTPTKVSVTITPVVSPVSYTLNTNCPTEEELIIVQVGLNSEENDGQFITNEFSWKDALITSPVASNRMTFAADPAVASQYMVSEGVRSLGVFPYSGANVTIRSNKINFDNYIWVVNNDNFRWLSSSVLYPNTSQGISDLLVAATKVANTAVTNPSPGVYQTTISSMSLPTANQYLYLVYDYRTINSASLCYDATSINESCCGCGNFCTPYSSSTVQQSSSVACVQPTGQTYYHDGLNSLPEIGDTVYQTSGCDSALKLNGGFYKIGSNGQWISVNTTGIVNQIGFCTTSTFDSSVKELQNAIVCTLDIDQLYYFSGAGTTPVANDYCYSDAGITPLANGLYRISSTQYIVITGGLGQVSGVGTCQALVYYPFNTELQISPQAACLYTHGLNDVYYTTSGTGPSDGAGTLIYSDQIGTVVTAQVFMYSVAPNKFFATDGTGAIDANGIQNC